MHRADHYLSQLSVKKAEHRVLSERPVGHVSDISDILKAGEKTVGSREKVKAVDGPRRNQIQTLRTRGSVRMHLAGHRIRFKEGKALTK